MKNIVFLLAIGLSHCLLAQEWHDDGNTGTTSGTNFLGTLDQERLLLKTHDEWRLQVNQTETGDFGGFTLMPVDGFVGISPNSSFWGAQPKGPFTRLHLAEGSGDNAQDIGYRPWQRNGMTLTGNADQGYVGHKYTFDDPQDHESRELEDFTDMVMQWSDNPGKALKDRMRFIFTSEYNEEDESGAGSLEGLEGMRLYPVDNDNINVGIGDWFAANVGDPSIIEPEERLDIVNGKVRIRQLPDDSPEEVDKVMVVDDDGVVHWRPFADFDECDWIVANEGVSGGATAHDLSTALGSNDLCPDEDDLVGIGVYPSAGKLHVFSNTAEQDVPAAGVFVRVESDDDDAAQGIDVQVAPDGSSGYNQVGVSSLVSNASFRNAGVLGKAELTAAITMSHENMGVQGISSVSSGTVTDASGVYGTAARSGGTVANNHGVFGYGNGGTKSFGTKGWSTGATTNYGAYGETWGTGTNFGVYGVGTGTGNYGGYFVGDLNVTGVASCPAMLWTSDANLKEDIQDITNASEVINALRPTTYAFDVEGHPALQLPAGLQRGLIAQEVAEVMPDLVQERIIATYTDHDGTVHEGETVQTLNYIGLIPMLIAAVQEQQE